MERERERERERAESPDLVALVVAGLTSYEIGLLLLLRPMFDWCGRRKLRDQY